MHIYFSGLGGVAIGPLALIAQDAGYDVSGSDLRATRLTKMIEARGIKVHIGQDGSQIASVQAQHPIDWLVISSAVPSDHPEVLFAKEHGIKISKRAELINFILQEKQLNLVAISGTHGKTTTTAMLTWLIEHYNTQEPLPVSYSIGTSLRFGPNGRFQPGSRYFVYECDEYDRNMLAFKPYLSALTNIDYDHPDIYPTRQDYQDAFRQFAAQSERINLWEEDRERARIDHPAMTVLKATDVPGIDMLRLPGKHMRQNAWQAIQSFKELFPEQTELDHLIEVMNDFPGTDRRFELLLKTTNDARVYTDYAHHPTEIKATLQMAHELNNHVIVVYQPHQNTRQHEIKDEYTNAFAEAAHVYWLPTYITRENETLEVLTPRQLISHLNNPQIAEPAEMDQLLIDSLKDELAKGSLILFMGAGTIDEWARAHFQ
jgi:UDP-N-acetylmuramate--alanine ligase